MNNLRMWAYAMIATGLINWDYQRATPNVAIHSMAIVIPGILLFVGTLIPALRETLAMKSVRLGWLFVGIAALLYAFIN